MIHQVDQHECVDTIDPDAPEPLFQQLADVLREQIRSGEIPPRRMLPSNRTLVQTYGIARGTASRAVAILISEGWAVTVRGRGVFSVAAEDRPAANSAPLAIYASRHPVAGRTPTGPRHRGPAITVTARLAARCARIRASSSAENRASGECSGHSRSAPPGYRTGQPRNGQRGVVMVGEAPRAVRSAVQTTRNSDGGGAGAGRGGGAGLQAKQRAACCPD